MQIRAVRCLVCFVVIIAGLALRHYGYDLGLPFWVVKYGGSALWAMMVFFLIAARWSRGAIVLGAGALALAIECSHLYHTPELDAFRLTTAGALLLGRVFSLWNLVAYVLGIALGAALDAGVPGCWKRDQGVTPKPKTPSNSDQRLA